LQSEERLQAFEEQNITDYQRVLQYITNELHTV